MKRILSALLIILILTCLFSFAYADNDITMGEVSISIKKDTVYVDAAINGFIDNIPFSVKVLSEDGDIEYIDYAYSSYGHIMVNFIPMNAEKGDTLILKITGVTTITRSFIYSEEDVNKTPLTKEEQEALNTVNKNYKSYEDLIGVIDFSIEVSSTSDYVKVKLVGDFNASDNIWKNKDSDRWNTYLYSMAQEFIKKLNKDVRINVFDSNKKLVDNKRFGSRGDWGQDISKLIQDLNKKYSTIKLSDATHSIRYSRGDVDEEFNTGDVLILNLLVSNLSPENFKDGDREEIQKFIDNAFEFAKEQCSYDIIFRVLSGNGNLYQNFDYFGSYDLESSQYSPINYNNGSFPISLMNYGNNSVIVPTNAIEISSQNGIYEASINNSTLIMGAMKNLKANEPCQVVFGIDPISKVDTIKMNVGVGILRILRERNAILTLNNPMMQLNIDISKIDTSSSISFTVSKHDVDDIYMDMGSSLYEVRLINAAGEDIKCDGIIGVFRFDNDFNRKISDIRKVSIMYYHDFSYETETILNGTYDSGLLGMRFLFNGSGVYKAEQRQVDFYDTLEHWGRDAIEVLAAKQMVYGIGDYRFEPDGMITRAEFVLIVARHLGIIDEARNYYSDLDADWFKNAVNSARAYGILPITMTDNEFRPYDTITREEMAYICVEAYSRVVGNKPGDGTILFDDAGSVSDWAYKNMSIAQRLEIIKGDGTNNCIPQGQSSRAEAAQVIYNLLAAEKLF